MLEASSSTGSATRPGPSTSTVSDDRWIRRRVGRRRASDRRGDDAGDAGARRSVAERPLRRRDGTCGDRRRAAVVRSLERGDAAAVPLATIGPGDRAHRTPHDRPGGVRGPARQAWVADPDARRPHSRGCSHHRAHVLPSHRERSSPPSAASGGGGRSRASVRPTGSRVAESSSRATRSRRHDRARRPRHVPRNRPRRRGRARRFGDPLSAVEHDRRDRRRHRVPARRRRHVAARRPAMDLDHPRRRGARGGWPRDDLARLERGLILAVLPRRTSDTSPSVARARSASFIGGSRFSVPRAAAPTADSACATASASRDRRSSPRRSTCCANLLLRDRLQLHRSLLGVDEPVDTDDDPFTRLDPRWIGNAAQRSGPVEPGLDRRHRAPIPSIRSR